jgi:hypothetical protein
MGTKPTLLQFKIQGLPGKFEIPLEKMHNFILHLLSMHSWRV